MKSKLPLVCIIILNWNGGKMTYDCLDSLKKKTSYKKYKTIVIDNGSSDGSDVFIKKNYPWVELVKSEVNKGYTGGMNLGWKTAITKYNPDYICNMNNDIITIQSSWLSNMVNYMEKNPSVGLTGCKLFSPNNTVEQWIDLQKKIIQVSSLPKNKMNEIIKVDATGGPIYLIKRELISKVGFNDENFFYGPDDHDYCLRSRNKGFEIAYAGTSEAIHVGCYSYNASKKKKSPQNIFIFGEQMKGKLIFTFRHGRFTEKVAMIFKQLFRVFFTRKDPAKRWSIKNAEFHKNFIQRFNLFLVKLTDSLINYKKIKYS